MELDWGALQTEAASAGVLPDGDYDLIVVEATATTSSTGKPMIKVKMRVTTGPHKDKPVWNQFVISPESAMALRMFFQHMNAFGLDSAFFAQNPSMDVVAKNLVNRTCVATLSSREWQGVNRNEVKSISPAKAGGPVAPGIVIGAPVVYPASSPTPVSTPVTPTSTKQASPPPPTPF